MTVYQHFRKEEYEFIDQVLSWKDIVLKSYRFHLTDFINPREQQIIKMLIGTKDEELQIQFFGGGSFTERKRAMIAPFYEQLNEESFELSLLQATYANKFITLSHRDVMGAFLSLGITRPKLGDIFVAEGIVQIITTKDIAPFVIANLTKIKNANIKLQEKPFSHAVEHEDEWIEAEHTVSSLRLDVILKEVYRISRKIAAARINKEQVKVNFKTVNDVKFPVYEGDLISVRGLGRSKLISVNGTTRKNRIRITTGMLK